MAKKYQFQIFRKADLIHGIFDKDFGSVSCRKEKDINFIMSKKNIARKLGIDWRKIFSLKQMHGTKIIKISRKGNFEKETRGDGLITNQKNVFLMIKTADCFPMLVFDPKTKAIGACHIGWRGAIGKIFLKLVVQMHSFFACQIKDLLIGIGPGLHPCCYHFKEVLQEDLPEWEKYIKKINYKEKEINLLGKIINELLEIGIKKKNIEIIDICTGCSNKFYSFFRYKKYKEEKGCFASIIGVE